MEGRIEKMALIFGGEGGLSEVRWEGRCASAGGGVTRERRAPSTDGDFTQATRRRALLADGSAAWESPPRPDRGFPSPTLVTAAWGQTSRSAQEEGRPGGLPPRCKPLHGSASRQ